MKDYNDIDFTRKDDDAPTGIVIVLLGAVFFGFAVGLVVGVLL